MRVWLRIVSVALCASFIRELSCVKFMSNVPPLTLREEGYLHIWNLVDDFALLDSAAATGLGGEEGRLARGRGNAFTISSRGVVAVIHLLSSLGAWGATRARCRAWVDEPCGCASRLSVVARIVASWVDLVAILCALAFYADWAR